MVDRDLVLRKLAEVERYLGELAEYRGLDLAAVREPGGRKQQEKFFQGETLD